MNKDVRYRHTQRGKLFSHEKGFPGDSDGKESAWSVGDFGWKDPLEKKTATHSSILIWRIPWTGEPGSLQSMGLQRVNGAINTFIH